MAFKILIAEDEDITLKHLVNSLQKEGYLAVGTQNGGDALRKIEDDQFDLLITDIKMPGLTGIELLEKIKERQLESEVIIITGFGSIGSVVDAMKKGAYDYVTKPFNLDELLLKVGKIRDQKALKKENIALKAYAGIDRKVSIIAKSESMSNILAVIEGMTDTDCNVLLTGVTGVGKSLLARIIHFTSRRRTMPFLSINCATLTEELLASELFGHEKGSFTGASEQRKGYFELADGGTIFLDEIGELPLSAQVKFLRILENGEFQRVGSSVPRRVDVRVIAATNKDLEREVRNNQFRADLFYRLRSVNIHIPPLRKRSEDVEVFFRHFVDVFTAKNKSRFGGISEEAMQLLRSYHWPGNVRELRNVVESMLVIEGDKHLEASDVKRYLKDYRDAGDDRNLPVPMGRTVEQAERELILRALLDIKGNILDVKNLLADQMNSPHNTQRDPMALHDQQGEAGLSLQEIEKRAIADALQRFKGNRRVAARTLNISERTLYRKIREYGLG